MAIQLGPQLARLSPIEFSLDGNTYRLDKAVALETVSLSAPGPTAAGPVYLHPPEGLLATLLVSFVFFPAFPPTLYVSW